MPAQNGHQDTLISTKRLFIPASILHVIPWPYWLRCVSEVAIAHEQLNHPIRSICAGRQLLLCHMFKDSDWILLCMSYNHPVHIHTVWDDGDPSRSIVPMAPKILNAVLTAIQRIYSSLWVVKKKKKKKRDGGVGSWNFKKAMEFNGKTNLCPTCFWLKDVNFIMTQQAEGRLLAWIHRWL